ncbi:MAG: hypothetical protein PHG19_05990 [Anaerotignum sp.]|nr:hypothetical protein [Anaerotignum sp.]
MRTGRIEINKKEYLLCFSARVIRACSQRYGSVDKIGEALTKGEEVEVMDECFWLLSTMMAAGARYAKLEEIPNPEPLSYDDLYDVSDLLDLSTAKERIFETVAEGNKREVEVEPDRKNAKAAQRK